METWKCTAAQALVRFLDQQYVSFDGKQTKFVEGVSVIFGHGIVLGLGEALLQKNHSLKVMQGKNEQGMAHMAIGFARQSHRRRIIAVSSSIGPGAANMVTAAATATANHIPLLLLPADTFASRQPDPVLQQIEQPHDLTVTTNDAFRPVSRYFDRISRPEMLMSAMINAMRVLTDPAETGAVTISLPQDVQAEIYDFPLSFFEKRVHLIPRTEPQPEMITKAAYKIIDSRHPMIICGGGCRYSEAQETLIEFCSEFRIPFAETQAGKSAVDSGCFYNLGGLGVTGNSAANQYAAQSDLILGLGTRLSDFTTGSKQLFAPAQIIQVNVSNYDGMKMDALKVTADAKTALEAIAKVLRQHHYHYENDAQISKLKRAWQTELQRLGSVDNTQELHQEIPNPFTAQLKEFAALTGSVLAQSTAVKIINNSVKPSAIVVAASGSLPGDLQRMWQSPQADGYHVEYGYSCMGYEIAAALGVKLACPEREVYCLVGDAAFLMLHSELVTALQQQVKIHICVFDNRSNGCISNLQMSSGLDSFRTDFRYLRDHEPEGALMPIDFAAIGRGYGCEAMTVRSPKELAEALRLGLQTEKTTLYDIKVLPKSMTNGYDSWWNVGLADVSPFPSVQEERQKLEEQRRKARAY